MFILKIRCEGAAFTRNHISTEVAEILQGVARSISEDQPLEGGGFTHKIFDSNGNACGELKFTHRFDDDN